MGTEVVGAALVGLTVVGCVPRELMLELLLLLGLMKSLLSPFLIYYNRRVQHPPPQFPPQNLPLVLNPKPVMADSNLHQSVFLLASPVYKIVILEKRTLTGLILTSRLS